MCQWSSFEFDCYWQTFFRMAFRFKILEFEDLFLFLFLSYAYVLIAYHSFKDITSCPAINFQYGNAFCRQCHLATKKYIISLNLILEIYHFHDTGNFTCFKELSQNMINYRASYLIFRRKTNFSIRKCENLSRVVCLKDNPFIAFGPMLRYFIVMRGDSCLYQILLNVENRFKWMLTFLW